MRSAARGVRAVESARVLDEYDAAPRDMPAYSYWAAYHKCANMTYRQEVQRAGKNRSANKDELFAFTEELRAIGRRDLERELALDEESTSSALRRQLADSDEAHRIEVRELQGLLEQSRARALAAEKALSIEQKQAAEFKASAEKSLRALREQLATTRAALAAVSAERDELVREAEHAKAHDIATVAGAQNTITRLERELAQARAETLRVTERADRERAKAADTLYRVRERGKQHLESGLQWQPSLGVFGEK